jgi:hypothetical protein
MKSRKAKSTRRQRMSAKRRIQSIAAIYKSLRRSSETIHAAWQCATDFSSKPDGTLGVIAAVLREHIGLEYLTNQAKHLAIDSGLEVRS